MRSHAVGPPRSLFGTSRAGHVVARSLLAVASVGAVTTLLVVVDADLTFAAIVLLVVVVAVSILGPAPGFTAAVLASVALNYWFTPPFHTLTIDQPDDVLGLVAFMTGSLAVGMTVGLLNRLRLRAELGAREARLRVAFTNSLAAGVPTAQVLQELADGMIEVFDLASCAIDGAGTRGIAGSETEGIDQRVVTSGPVSMRLSLLRPLRDGEPETLEALAIALATALEHARLDAAARDQRVHADLVRTRAAFLATITHDLRTPLATIKAATAALRTLDAALPPDERRELAAAAHEEADRLVRLVDKALELTRIKAGAVVTHRVELAASDLVRLATERLDRSVVTSRVRLDLGPDLPTVEVDPLLMEHVLLNLVENALLHDPGSSTVVIKGRVAEGQQLELLVIDRGPGVPAVARDRVFDEFVRLGAPTDGPGTGLGLAVARGLTEVHGGTVRCAETPGGGATFIVSLPTAKREREIAQARGAAT
jgi:two-component system sensor histidine kinase KdpD